jgi:hypothetical protein
MVQRKGAEDAEGKRENNRRELPPFELNPDSLLWSLLTVR